jgi:hypothetical protein
MFLSGQVACNLHIKSAHSLSQITSICPGIILSPKMGQPIPQKCWCHLTTLSGVNIQRQSDEHLFLHWTCRCLFGSFILFWDGVLFIIIVKLCIYFLSSWLVDDVSDNIHGILHCHCNKSRERNMIWSQEPWVCSDYHKLQTGYFNLLRRETAMSFVKLVMVKTVITSFFFMLACFLRRLFWLWSRHSLSRHCVLLLACTLLLPSLQNLSL